MCGNCNVISLAAAPFDKKATNKFILNRHRWGPSLVASSQWGVFLGFHLWGPVIWYSVNVQNQVGSIKLSGQVLLMCSVCCCISERTTQYDMHVCWGHTPTDFPSADIVCRLTAGLIARLQGFGCCTLPLAPRWVGTVIQCLLMLRRLPAYRLPGHRATQTVYTVWIAFLWRACWWKDKKKKKKKKNRLTIEYTKCTVRLLSYWICSKGSLWGFLASFMISLRSRPGSLAGEAAWPSAHPSDSHFLPGQIGQNQQDLHCAVHLPTSAWMFPTDSTAHWDPRFPGPQWAVKQEWMLPVKKKKQTKKKSIFRAIAASTPIILSKTSLSSLKHIWSVAQWCGIPVQVYRIGWKKKSSRQL